MHITILMLLLVTIVVLVFDSGFIDSMDKIVNKHFPLRHIPRPFSCVYCSSWWAQVILLLITGNFTLFYIMLALLFSKATTIIQNVINLAEALVNRLLAFLMNIITIK